MRMYSAPSCMACSSMASTTTAAASGLIWPVTITFHSMFDIWHSLHSWPRLCTEHGSFDLSFHIFTVVPWVDDDFVHVRQAGRDHTHSLNSLDHMLHAGVGIHQVVSKEWIAIH